VIGITRDGRRILRFRYDKKRNHSPITKKTGDVIIIESKSTAKYLRQLENSGQNTKEYQSIWGYSVNETETWSPLYQYHDYAFETTKAFTNLEQDLM
jgi:lysine 2,3-aminomutase